jgi:hypothetical protein
VVLFAEVWGEQGEAVETHSAPELSAGSLQIVPALSLGLCDAALRVPDVPGLVVVDDRAACSISPELFVLLQSSLLSAFQHPVHVDLHSLGLETRVLLYRTLSYR